MKVITLLPAIPNRNLMYFLVGERRLPRMEPHVGTREALGSSNLSGSHLGTGKKMWKDAVSCIFECGCVFWMPLSWYPRFL